jgi:hypothetical protein
VHTRIIPRTRISPMQRVIHVPSTQGIVVTVVQLLQHHFVVFDLLRMASFLPELVLLIDLVPQFEVLKFL